MVQLRERTVAARLGRILTSFTRRLGPLTLYYLLILSGLAVLYGRGGFSTTGFIYQAF